MGSDQSSQHGHRKKGKNPKRSQSAGNDSDPSGRKFFGGSSSPRPSVCSDSDIPYISYATTRPISEGTCTFNLKYDFQRQLKLIF